MMDYMGGIEAGENVPLTTGIKNFCVRNTGKGIFILITDLMDKEGYDKALRFLVAQQMDVYVIHVLCPEEISPDLKGTSSSSTARTTTRPKSPSAARCWTNTSGPSPASSTGPATSATAAA
jgi:hypothetical protein